MDAVIDLIAVSFQKDAYGVPQPTEIGRQVFAQAESVTRAEFYQGGRNGLNPELVFTVFAADYRGEAILSYKGQRYGVYRTFYKAGDYMELYAERKGGTNG